MRILIVGILFGIAFDASVTAAVKHYLNRAPQQRQSNYVDKSPGRSLVTISNKVQQTDIAPDRPDYRARS